MTHHTPVVFSDDPEVQSAARARRWVIVERHPENPSALRIQGVGVLAGMPQPEMVIAKGSLDAASTPTWNYILNWLGRFVHRPMLIVPANGYATDLALWAAESRGWPIGALVHGEQPVATPQAVSLFTSADGFFIPDPEVSALFRSRWPAQVTMLHDTALVDIAPTIPVPPAHRVPGVTRVLLVGYYAGPCPTVGVQRINYWFEELERLSDGAVMTDLALATPWPDAPARVHHVPDHGVANLTHGREELPAAGRAVLEGATMQAYPATRQIGGVWHWALERYFDQRDDHYDVVIISGNPFPPFEFARYAKRRWYARTILDYRDPFAMSPRVDYTPEGREYARYLEAGWNMTADVVTVVNQACVPLVVAGGPDQRTEVIPNGFDERLSSPRRQGRAPGPLRFGHAGQLFALTPPDSLLEALARTGHEFHHMGDPLTHLTPATVVNHGRLPRDEVLQRLAGVDCGVAYVSGSGIETPTKVFDYLAAGLDLLILHRENKSTALSAMLEGVDGVHWVRDTPEDITDWLTGYEPQDHPDPERSERFGRRASTEDLIRIVLELGDHSYRPEHLGG